MIKQLKIYLNVCLVGLGGGRGDLVPNTMFNTVVVLICLAQRVAILRGMALLELVWPCWRKCVPVGLGFETFLQDSWK